MTDLIIYIQSVYFYLLDFFFVITFYIKGEKNVLKSLVFLIVLFKEPDALK